MALSIDKLLRNRELKLNYEIKNSGNGSVDLGGNRGHIWLHTEWAEYN
jgi:hypothetical protein